MVMFRRRRQQFENKRVINLSLGVMFFGVAVFVGVIFVFFLSWRSSLQSLVFGNPVRSTLAIATEVGEVGIVSFDPSERKITQLEIEDIEFRSRSVGEYKMSQLYALGGYDSGGGEWVRNKLQGFLRIPLLDYLVVDKIDKTSIRLTLAKQMIGVSKRSELSTLDLVSLLYWSFSFEWHLVPFETMAREGAVELSEGKYQVNDLRLRQFVGERLFDWLVGEESWTVTILNESGMDGLGSDVAAFLTNVGMDVIAVRSADERGREITSVRLGVNPGSGSVSERVLRVIMPENSNFEYNQDLEEYRSEVVIILGSDMQYLF